MPNIWDAFKQMLGEDTVQIGTVSAVDGVAYIVDLVGTGQLRVVSTTDLTVGDNVFLKGNTVTGKAPPLSIYNIDI